MPDPGKVVATITRTEGELIPGLAQLQELASELVMVKAKVAECLNEITLYKRLLDEHESYVRRSVKRMDATVARIVNPRAPRVRG